MRKELLTFKEPKSPVSEIFRTLRTNIQFMNTNGKMKTLLITSTFPGEGKSWITANLAVTFAQAGKRVILIDADMRKGRQYKIFDILPKPGLSNYLSNMDAENMEMDAENINIANYIQNTDVENLHILVSGNVPPNPSELLVSKRMRTLLQELKEMCDLIIIDGTPCDLVTDSIILSRFVDSTIIVTAQKETKKDNLERIVKNIQNVGGKIAGVVVNKVDMSTKKYNQQYYYGSISGNGLKKKSKHSKRTDEMISDLFKATKKEEKLETDKELKEEISDLLDDVEEGENIKNIMDEFVDFDRENNEKNSDDIEVKEEKSNDSEQTVEENSVEQEIEAETENKEQQLGASEQEEEQNDIANNEDNIEKEIEKEQIETSQDENINTNNILHDKTEEIINLVNNYIESEKRKQERKF